MHLRMKTQSVILRIRMLRKYCCKGESVVVFYPLSSFNTLHTVFSGSLLCIYDFYDYYFIEVEVEMDDVCLVFSCNNTFKYIVL